MTAGRAPGVAARTLRRIALLLIVAGGAGLIALDHPGGLDAVLLAVAMLVVYGLSVALPMQLLFRDVRLRAPGVLVFLVAVLAIVGIFWCLPVQRSDVYTGDAGLVALHRLTGGGDVAGASAAPWQQAALIFGLVAIVAALTLFVIVWRMQRSSHGHAVNPTVAGSVLASFATLPEPQGGTSVTRPAPTPHLERRPGES